MRRFPWLASLLAVLLLLVGNKVLSPQYIAWGAPLAAVAGGRWFRGYVVVAALTLALGLPHGRAHDAFMVLALLRNAALVGLTGAGGV